MRKGIANSGLSTYFNIEVYLNNIKLVPINSNTEKAIAVALVDSSGNQINPIQASSAALSNVAGNASSVTLLASNTSRKGVFIFNDSSSILYVKFGSTASTSSFTFRLTPFALYESKSPVYTGIITGIWDSATGNARITEIT